VQREYGQEAQVAVIMPLLEGTDGVQKMSKSLGNYIGIDEPPAEIFGKVMSISDDLMWRYYELLTDLTVEEVGALRRSTESGQGNPRDIKAELAKRIINDFYSREESDRAEEEFVKRFRNKETPENIEERVVPSSEPEGWELTSLLVTVGLAESKAEARRLVQQGGVSIDAERQEISNLTRHWEPGASALLKVGKRRFIRVQFT